MFEQMLRQRPIDGRAIFIDMNSFFASCEQQANPELRGQPLGVCPFISNATVVIAASTEAKRFGIKTGTRVPEAKLLCPRLQLVQANPRLYREFHRRLMAALDNLNCKVSAKSIDEALLLVPSYARHQAAKLGLDVKTAVRSVGSDLKCSVAIASNMFLAKMGTNLRKPDGFLEIKTAELADFYAPLELTDLHGISWRMKARLNAIGITTPVDFYEASLPLLREAFGVNGEAWYLRLRGYEVDLAPTTRRIIGHQMTIVPQPARSRAEVLSVASQLTYRAAIRLRQSGYAARGIAVYLRFQDHSGWKNVYHAKYAFTDSSTFFLQVKRLPARATLPA